MQSSPASERPARIHALLALIVACCLLLPISGCLLNRLLTVRGQVCDFEDHFVLDMSDGIRLTSLHPVLTAEDVTWMAGTEPTERRDENEDVILTWVVEKSPQIPETLRSIPLELRFERFGRKLRLRESRAPAEVAAFIDLEMLTESLDAICHARPKLLRRNVALTLTPDRARMPSRTDLTTLLGLPTRSDDDSVTYDFRVVAADGGHVPAILHVRFAADGRPDEWAMRYRRYRVEGAWSPDGVVTRLRLF